MQTVGQILHEARLKKGLTLEALSERTRISLKNLGAIEADDPSGITSAFFYRSFVRQFADALEVNYDTLAESVNAFAGALPEPRVPGQEDRTTKLPAIHPQRRGGIRWALPGVALLAVLAGCSALYAVWEKTQDVSAPTVVSSQSPKPASSGSSRPAQSSESAAKAPSSSSPLSSSSGSPAESAQLAVPAEGFLVKISALERTWLSIESDGKRVYSGVMEAADTKVLEGREEARIRTGNAGGVTVLFNGKQIGPLGQRGQVRTVLFTQRSYEIIQPESRVELKTVANISE